MVYYLLISVTDIPSTFFSQGKMLNSTGDNQVMIEFMLEPALTTLSK